MRHRLKTVSDTETTAFWEDMKEFIDYLNANELHDYKRLLYKVLEDNVKLYTKLEEKGHDFQTGTNTEEDSTAASERE